MGLKTLYDQNYVKRSKIGAYFDRLYHYCMDDVYMYVSSTYVSFYYMFFFVCFN